MSRKLPGTLYWGSRRYGHHAQHGMTPVISSSGSSQVLCASIDATTVLRVITPHDREGSEVSFHARHERAVLSREDGKDQKWSYLSLCLRHFVRSWGVCAPLLRLYSD